MTTNVEMLSSDPDDAVVAAKPCDDDSRTEAAP